MAKALSHGVRLPGVDEPNAPLGQQETETLFGVMRRLRDQGVTVIHSAHRLEEIFLLADRLTVLRDPGGGRLLWILHKPAPVGRFTGAAVRGSGSC